MKRLKKYALDHDWYRIASTLTDRDAIPAEERQVMLKVGVQANGTTYVLYGGISNSDWIPEGASGGDGTVTSVGLSMPTQFAVANSPITTTGVFNVTWANATQNHVFAGPSGGSGTPSFRALLPADLVIGSGSNSTEYLSADGTWSVPSGTGGSGNVSNTGTPLDGQVAVWVDATTIEGTANLKFDGELFLYRPTTGGLHIETANTSTRVWRIGEATGGYGFYLTYRGDLSSIENRLEYWSENQAGDDINYAQVDQNGAWRFLVDPMTDGISEWTSGVGVTMNHKFYLAGIPSSTQSNVLYYNSTTDEISYGTTPSGGGGGTVTSITAGNGLDFSTITATGAVTLGVPSTDLTLSTTNALTSTSHTHALSLPTFAGSSIGFVPTSTGGTSNYLRADGTWAAPGGAGGGTVTAVSAGSGMAFTTITGSGAVTMGTPGDCTLATSNQAISSYHTHNLDINTFAGTDVGLVPAATGSLTLYLRADGNWVAPSGSGTVTSVAAGNGLTFTTITGSGSVILGTPGDCTLATSNGVTANSHVHNLIITTFSGSSVGLVPTAAGNAALFLSGAGTWLTPAGSGTGTVTSVGSGGGMSFSTITATGSVTMGNPSDCTLATGNSVLTSSHTHNLNINTFSGSSVGLVPASTSGGTYYLNGVGAWTIPTGGGSSSVGSSGDMQMSDGAGSFLNSSNFTFTSTTLGIGTTVVPGLGNFSLMVYRSTGGLANFRTYGSLRGYITIEAQLTHNTAVTFNDGGVTRWSIGSNGSGEFHFRQGALADFSSGDQLILTAAGALTAKSYMRATNYLLSSDPRLKTDTQSIIEHGLELALTLKPISYEWIDSATYGLGRQIGFSSHDVREVHGSLVFVDGKGYDMVDYHKIVVINNAGIHQLNLKVETNEQKIVRLENRVKELEHGLST